MDKKKYIRFWWDGSSPTFHFKVHDAHWTQRKVMEVVGLSLNAALVRTPLSNSRASEDGFIKHSIFSTRTVPKSQKKRALVVEAKGKRGMQGRQFQRQPPPLPKIEDDGNPKFVIFIRMANVCTTPFLGLLWKGFTLCVCVSVFCFLLSQAKMGTDFFAFSIVRERPSGELLVWADGCLNSKPKWN